MTNKRTLLYTIVLFTLLALWYAPSYAGTISVNPGDSIQDAIDGALVGDIVRVMAGTYDQGDINMAPDVDLMGELYGEATILGQIIMADNTELGRLRIENSAGGGISVPANNVTIKNTVIHVADTGILINAAASVTIESNTVHSQNGPCVYSQNSDYILRNNILTVAEASLNAIVSDNDTAEISYNCILGRISPITLAHKGSIFAGPGYVDAAGGDFHLAMAMVDRESPSMALDAGDPASQYSSEPQLTANNKAIDLGAYGNTDDTVLTTFRADFNLDGSIDIDDFSILKSNFGADATHSQGDANDDGTVDIDDFSILKSHFGESL